MRTPPFPPWANTAVKIAVALVVVAVVGGLGGLMIYVRTPYNTTQLKPVDQPVEFDHRHHAVDDEIDCLYCHRTAERSPSAGIPATEVCMGCHAQVWQESPLLEPVRRSYFSGQPLPWNRVHNLADFVYFDHGVHVRSGVGCVECHGRVDQMPRVVQVAPLTMTWCLDCHRNPTRRRAERARGPEDQATMWGATAENLSASWPEDSRAVTRLTTCTACHR